MSFDPQFKSADLINNGYVWESLSSNLSLYLVALRICDKRNVRRSQDVTQPRAVTDLAQTYFMPIGFYFSPISLYLFTFICPFF